jgi:RimJ/RimL family protein N-acetyltransferase
MSLHPLKNGERLTIRRLEGSDAQAMLMYLKQVGGETGNLTFGSEGLPYTLEQETALLEAMKSNPDSYMICGTIDGSIVSVGNVSSPGRARMKHNAQLGISVLKSSWNKGVATKMIEALLQFARAHGSISVVSLRVREDNLPAIHLYEKFGFFHTGRIYKEFLIDGVYYDSLTMSLDLTKHPQTSFPTGDRA